MDECVKGVWDEVKLGVPEPDSSLSQRDQIAYIHGVLSCQKGKHKNPYTVNTSLQKQFSLGFSVAEKEKERLHKKLVAQQKKLAFRDKKHDYF